MKLTRQGKVLRLPTTNLDNNTVSKCKVVGLGRPPSREWVTSMVSRSGLNWTTSYWFGWSPPVGGVAPEQEEAEHVRGDFFHATFLER